LFLSQRQNHPLLSKKVVELVDLAAPHST
jgi:hypothetical protein